MWWWIGPPRVVNDGRTHERGSEEFETLEIIAEFIVIWKFIIYIVYGGVHDKLEHGTHMRDDVLLSSQENRAKWDVEDGEMGMKHSRTKKSHQRRHFNVGMFCIHLLSTLLVSSHFTSLHVPCPARERRRRGGKWTWTTTKKKLMMMGDNVCGIKSSTKLTRLEYKKPLKHTEKNVT